MSRYYIPNFKKIGRGVGEKIVEESHKKSTLGYYYIDKLDLFYLLPAYEPQEIE